MSSSSRSPVLGPTLAPRPTDERAPDGGSVRLGVVAVVALVAVGVVIGGLIAGGLAVVALAGRAAPDTVAVAPDPDAAASADGYAVWDRRADGTPVRWDPCTPIELVVSTVGAPPGIDPGALRGDVVVAADAVAAASGLDVVVVGTTDEVPAVDRPTAVAGDAAPRWAPVLVGWATPRADGLPLRDTDRAVAIPVAAPADGGRVLVTGQVVLNAERTDLVTGREDRATSWGATLQHELGHVVGLAHVEDRSELMATHPGSGAVRFGPGDLAGLAAVGADGGCLPRPPPRDLEVVVPDR